MGTNQFGYNPALQRVLEARPDAITPRVDYDCSSSGNEWLTKYNVKLSDEEHVMNAIFPAVFKNYFTGPCLSNVPTPLIYQVTFVSATLIPCPQTRNLSSQFVP